jgi:hypothetical protein
VNPTAVQVLLQLADNWMVSSQFFDFHQVADSFFAAILVTGQSGIAHMTDLIIVRRIVSVGIVVIFFFFGMVTAAIGFRR